MSLKDTGRLNAYRITATFFYILTLLKLRLVNVKKEKKKKQKTKTKLLRLAFGLPAIDGQPGGNFLLSP